MLTWPPVVLIIKFELAIQTSHPTLREALLDPRRKSKSEYVFEGRKTIKRAWENALRKSGISHCRFHDLRHTFATRLVMEGVDLVNVTADNQMEDQWSGREDSNLRPRRPKRRALPSALRPDYKKQNYTYD
jgi:integrase